MSSIRVQRFEKELTRLFSTTLSSKIRNSNLSWVTITAVRLSSDLSNAKVYFTHLSSKSHKFLENELNKSVGVFKNEIARAKIMRTIPEITFFFDELAEKANRLEKLFKQIHAEDKEEGNATE